MIGSHRTVTQDGKNLNQLSEVLMCDAKEHELATVEQLLKHIVEDCPYKQINGRCEYHDDMVKATYSVRGSVKVLMWFLIPAFLIFIGLQTTTLWKLFDHSKDAGAHHKPTTQGASDVGSKPTASSDEDSGVLTLDTLQVGWGRSNGGSRLLRLLDGDTVVTRYHTSR